MKYLVVGLGNPGDKFVNTRHNVGFKIVEAFAKDREAEFLLDKQAEVAKAKLKGRTIILIKPTTFMNLSGKAVNYWMQQEKIPIKNVLIITDDIALPFGKLRLKGKGSDGGHNGLKSIQESTNTSQFSRLRFGIGNEFFQGQQSDYVLSKWNTEQNEALEQRIAIATEFIKGFTTIGLQLTMTNWNNK